MSVYFNDRRGWYEYYFRLNKKPYTGAGFKKKKEALEAEAEKKKELKKPKEEESTGMAFLTLLNNRLDHIQAYRSKRHYIDTVYMAKRYAMRWKEKDVHQITREEVTMFLIERKNSTSAHAANKDLRSLRALWNFGAKQRWFALNPTDGIDFFPVEKQAKYVPPLEDVIRVIMAADGESQDYLWAIAMTMGRMSEINRLQWEAVDFANKSVKLYTRKTKGGNLVPRTIPMGQKLEEVLKRRLKGNHTEWVFPHTYFSRKENKWMTGPYDDRKKMMTTLCKKAGVRYFRFHPLRHFGASVLMKEGVDGKTIQSLLGHSNFKTTEIYLHSIKGTDKDAMDRLDSAFKMINFEKRKTSAQD